MPLSILFFSIGLPLVYLMVFCAVASQDLGYMVGARAAMGC